MTQTDDLETDIRRMMGAEAQPSQAAKSVDTWLAEMSRSDPALAAQIREQFNFADDALNLADTADDLDFSQSLPAIAIDADTHGRIHDLARNRGETLHQVMRRLLRAGIVAHAKKGK